MYVPMMYSPSKKRHSAAHWYPPSGLSGLASLFDIRRRFRGKDDISSSSQLRTSLPSTVVCHKASHCPNNSFSAADRLVNMLSMSLSQAEGAEVSCAFFFCSMKVCNSDAHSGIWFATSSRKATEAFPLDSALATVVRANPRSFARSFCDSPFFSLSCLSNVLRSKVGDDSGFALGVGPSVLCPSAVRGVT